MTACRTDAQHVRRRGVANVYAIKRIDVKYRHTSRRRNVQVNGRLAGHSLNTHSNLTALAGVSVNNGSGRRGRSDADVGKLHDRTCIGNESRGASKHLCVVD